MNLIPEDILPELIQKLPDEQFRMMMWTTAEMFKRLKEEAIRRGIWDELKTKKIIGNDTKTTRPE